MQEHLTRPSQDKTDAGMMTGIDEGMNENGYIYLRMDLWWSLCTLYLPACQVRVYTIGDSGLCCCTCVTYF